MNIKKIIKETINKFLNESSHTIYTNTQGDTFWGDIGCGVLPIAKSTGKILIALRSQYVNEPGTWGVIGGAVDSTDGNIKETAKREFKEETSYGGNIQLIPAYIFETPNKTFKYYNFIGIIPEEFEPTSDWETERFEWITYEELLSLKNKHFGLTKLLEDENSLRIIESYANLK